MGDGETLLVGPGQAEVRATTSGSGDPAVSERVPDREPISEVPEPPPFTLSPETSPASVDLAKSHSETVMDTVKPSMLSQGVIATTSIPILSSTIPTQSFRKFLEICLKIFFHFIRFNYNHIKINNKYVF